MTAQAEHTEATRAYHEALRSSGGALAKDHPVSVRYDMALAALKAARKEARLGRFTAPTVRDRWVMSVDRSITR